MSRERHRPDAALIDRLRAAIGDAGLVDDEAALRRYNTSPWSDAAGGARLVLRPRSTDEVSACMRLCAETRIGVVPYGGGTGFLEGQIAAADGSEIVLSLERMTTVRAFDDVSCAAIVEAGVTVAGLRRTAAEHGLTFPLTFGADESSEIGGALSTNAGGMNALRYGSARDLCLGLEVVLASGDVVDLLKSVCTDNTGYDLKHLFIGAEGTLGIITAAALKLAPQPRAIACALIGLPDIAAAVTLLTLARKI
jgi:FAD/FMN-containing dehydrogenase